MDASILRNPLPVGWDRQTLSQLMALYESNFRRLMRLLPERHFPLDRAVSLSPISDALHLTVVSRDRFTVTLHLTHRYHTAEFDLCVPDQWLRVYYDAAQAEALPEPGVLDIPTAALQPRMERNRRLNQWLGALLAAGHGFAGAGRPRLCAARLFDADTLSD